MNLKELNIKILKKARLITYVFSFLLLALTFVFYFNGKEFDQFSIANAAGYLAFAYIALSLAIGPFMKLVPKFELNSSLFLAKEHLELWLLFLRSRITRCYLILFLI